MMLNFVYICSNHAVIWKLEVEPEHKFLNKTIIAKSVYLNFKLDYSLRFFLFHMTEFCSLPRCWKLKLNTTLSMGLCLLLDKCKLSDFCNMWLFSAYCQMIGIVCTQLQDATSIRLTLSRYKYIPDVTYDCPSLKPATIQTIIQLIA